jgi:hypothetical protein
MFFKCQYFINTLTLGARQKRQPSITIMTLRTIIFFLTLLFVTHVLAQPRTLTGKIIDHEFNTLYQVGIFSADTVLVAKSDTNGNFSIAIPSDTKTIIVADVGREWKIIDLLNDCNNLEIILQPMWTYDFKLPAKVDRLRKKQFDKLPALHQSAFEKGIFNKGKPCYLDKFIRHKKEMKERHKATTRMPST